MRVFTVMVLVTSSLLPLLALVHLEAVAAASVLRVRLNPLNVPDKAETGYLTWTIAGEKRESITVNSTQLHLTLSAGNASLKGSSDKYRYTRIVSSLGERVVSEGISTDAKGGGPISLTITGLSVGQHTLLTWHNGWDEAEEAATLSVSVDGETVVTNVTQSVRVGNMWEAATSYVRFSVASARQAVRIVYYPSGADGRAFLNAFEIDTPALGDQISFPSPAHREEHLDLADSTSVEASWRAPATAESPTYDVYMGTSASALTAVASGLKQTRVELTGLNRLDTFYWRIDVVSGDAIHLGRVFHFRLAHLAFPGAEGWGRFARGGRDGKVVKVTTLDDNSEEGSLRYALTVVEGPRIVVFDVGGVITTTSRISINSPDITVAGQTAPGKGIVIQGYPVGLSGASDSIFRHVRVRPGRISNQTVDGMGMQGSNFAIFDRCSIGWTIDEAFSSRAAYNITFQRSMISEPLNVAGHKNYPAGTEHGYAASIGGDVGSFHHNLLAHAEGRSWSMAGALDNNGVFAGLLDIRNNVVYNFGNRVTDGGGRKVNFVGNLYLKGPASRLNYALQATYEDGKPGTQQYYCAGNAMPGVFDQDSVQHSGDGTAVQDKIACWASVTITPAPTYQKFVAAPFFNSHVETHTATEAFKRVLSDSGASQPVLDEHDARVRKETLTQTATYNGSVTGKPGLIDDPADAGGLEHFPATTRPASWDADGDGIADWWDGSTGGEGYTPIEGYINFMAEPHVFVEPSSSVSIHLASLAAGFLHPTFTVTGPDKGSVKVRGTEATYYAGPKSGIDYLTVRIDDAEGSTWSGTLGVAIFAGAEAAVTSF